MASPILPSGHRFIDMTGQRVGRRVVVSFSHFDGKNSHWLCRCDCGKVDVANGTSLRQGKANSCGCLREDTGRSNVIDRVGERHGRLVVLRRAENVGRGARWLCRCDCGAEKVISANCLGKTRSCGCLRRENSQGLIHGQTGTPMHRLWVGMIQRCHGKNTPRNRKYTDRGIRVCGGWRSDFAAFQRDMGERPSPAHTIDRKDNDRGYDCGRCADCLAKGATPNCAWATPREQALNRRSTRMITWRGETLPAIVWQERTGILSLTMLERIGRGWGIDRAMTERPHAGGRRRDPQLAALAERLLAIRRELAVGAGDAEVNRRLRAALALALKLPLQSPQEALP